MMTHEVRPAEVSPEELSWETHKLLTADSLAMSVNAGYLERDKAVELYEFWFSPDETAIAGLYRMIENGKNA